MCAISFHVHESAKKKEKKRKRKKVNYIALKEEVNLVITNNILLYIT
jgi:hypothetical protein